MKNLIAALVLAFVFISCNKDGANTNFDNFDQVVELGGAMADPPPASEEILDESLSDETQEGELWRCTSQTLSVGYNSGGQGGFPQFNPNASVIYPGSLLQGSSLSKATPDVIAVERAGGTISIDILDGSATSSFSVDRVAKSSITNASNAIISGSTGSIPANMEFSYEKIQSREQMAAALKVDYHNAFAEVEAKLSFSSDKSYNRTIVNLTQSYYTMSYDIPTSLEQVFDASVTPEDLSKYVGPNNPATYVSDVTYGRIYMLLVETTSSESEMDAAVNASFNGAVTGGGIDAEVNKLSSLKNLKVKLFAFGGESSSTLLTIGEAGDLQKLTELLAEGTDVRTGKPISYVVRSVYNNQIVKVGLNTEYDVTNCEPLNPNGTPPPYTRNWTGLMLDFGAIGAATTLNGSDRFLLVNKEGREYIITENGELEGPFSIDDLGTTPCPLQSIGAAAYIEGSNINGSIMFFDELGVNFTYYNIENKTWLPAEKVSDWGGGAFPFNLKGTSAALNYGVENSPNDPSQQTNIRAFFEANSQRYCLFHSYDNDGFDWPQDMSQFVLNQDYLLEGVGAGIGFKLGDQRFRLLFNEAGDTYTIVVDDWNDYYLGPYRI